MEVLVTSEKSTRYFDIRDIDGTYVPIVDVKVKKGFMGYELVVPFCPYCGKEHAYSPGVTKKEAYSHNGTYREAPCCEEKGYVLRIG